jgi:methylenetetrahydrofolate reductase (NADPH)
MAGHVSLRPMLDLTLARRECTDTKTTMAAFLREYSTEVSPLDRESIAIAPRLLPRGGEVFINSPSIEASHRQRCVARYLRRAGMIPIPHIVARDIPGLQALENTLAGLAGDAGVDRVLLLAGDRRIPAGEIHSSLQVIESGFLNKYGIRNVWISAYPEGHPRMTPGQVRAERFEKTIAAAQRGLSVSFLTQFCFESAPIIDLVREIRSSGMSGAVRIGLAGPAKRALLRKYARTCGIGRSADRLHSGGRLNALVSPEGVLREVLAALLADPRHDIDGAHFFNFDSLAATVQWARDTRCREELPA